MENGLKEIRSKLRSPMERFFWEVQVTLGGSFTDLGI